MSSPNLKSIDDRIRISYMKQNGRLTGLVTSYDETAF